MRMIYLNKSSYYDKHVHKQNCFEKNKKLPFGLKSTVDNKNTRMK